MFINIGSIFCNTIAVLNVDISMLNLRVFLLCTKVHMYYLDEGIILQELVAYYQENTLGDNFPHVNTTLRFPYKSVFAGAQGLRHSQL